MIILPAIDLYGGKAVRLLKGDYREMTVYSEKPESVGKAFAEAGATHIHLVDLEGARNGETPNLDTVIKIKKETGLFCEVGGGIRSMEVVERYISGGLDRVILGTAAVTDEDFLKNCVDRYGEKTAVSVDIREGFVAIRGWTEKSTLSFLDFCEKMSKIGVSTLICTDISRDGAMKGTNYELYRLLSSKLKMKIIASGGVSTMEDIIRLKELNLYGAIIGKAYYTGQIDLKQAIEVAE